MKSAQLIQECRWKCNRGSGQHQVAGLKRFRQRHGRAQCLATGRAGVPGRLGLGRQLARAAILLPDRFGFMALERGQTQRAMIRDREPRDRSQRHRCPTKGDRSARAQHAISLA